MDGTLRWAVNTEAWQPTPEQWSTVLACLPAAEQARCLRYRHTEDQKRAVVSQLLQRACVVRVLGVAWDQLQLQRTKGGKPFYAGPASRQHVPNFNYNVSHEGDYVVLASEGHCICGVDVAAPSQLRRPGSKRSLVDTIQLLKGQLSADEWALMQCLSGNEDAVDSAFQSIWSCKEALIKARGDGVAFEPLSRIHVQLPMLTPTSSSDVQPHQAVQPTQAVQPLQPAQAVPPVQAAPPIQPVQAVQLVVDGRPQPRWRAYLQQLPHRHWVAVVRAPPECVVDAAGAFKATLAEPNIPDQQLQVYLDAHSPAFDMLTVEDLLPEAVLDQYFLC